jgi:polyisoprenyl-teichoic acid--peptidoglycan teichoic acid transferase
MAERRETDGREAPPGSASDPPPRARRSDTTPRQRRRQRRAPDAPATPPTAASGAATVRDATGSGGTGSRRRRSGRRADASRRRRRRARVRRTVGVGLLLVFAAATVLLASLGVDGTRELVAPSDTVPPAPLAPGDRQPALALVTYDETTGDTAAAAVVVLAHDRDDGQGTVLLVPAGTVADVPGHGSSTVGDAYTFGEGPLVAVTVDNLLDVRLDGVVAVSSAGWAALADVLGPIEVEVRSRLVAEADGGGEVRFEPGAQQLEGDRLAEFVTFRGAGETELEALPRIQQVIAGLLDRIAEDPAPLRALLGLGEPPPDPEGPAAEAGAIPLESSDPALTYALLTELAEAQRAERLTTLTLPVSPLGSGQDDLYRVDAERAGAVIEERLAASRPTDTAGAGRTLQVLNGNGVPGIGQQVAERLQPGGYRILLTGNADRFSYETTRIVVYDDAPEQLAVARDIRERLGTGEIERSGTPQSVVDVTIVVGADFPPQ